MGLCVAQHINNNHIVMSLENSLVIWHVNHTKRWTQ